MKPLSRDELRGMIGAEQDFLLINVLSEEFFDREHIPGSENVPLKDENFEQEVEWLAGGHDRLIVVYCASFESRESSAAAERLTAAGFRNVYDYEGGMRDWKSANLPVASTLSH